MGSFDYDRNQELLQQGASPWKDKRLSFVEKLSLWLGGWRLGDLPTNHADGWRVYQSMVFIDDEVQPIFRLSGDAKKSELW